jgi:hypothetical protein
MIRTMLAAHVIDDLLAPLMALEEKTLWGKFYSV